MSISVNGSVFKSLDLTRAWGVNPASGTGRAYGEFINPGTSVVMNIGGLTFSGVVANCMQVEDDGRAYQIDLVDNRIRLAWDTVYCAFNLVEIREDNPLTPGIDRQRRYKHILPSDWPLGLETISDAPLNAWQILAYLKSAPEVTFPWAFDYHPNLSAPVFDLDASQGKTLANVLQEICERCNLLCTLEGSSTIRFAIKGEDTAPDPSPTNSSNRSSGQAIGPPTWIRIVGDRNLYQVTPLDLEPDWNRAYEAFWFQGFWMAEVKWALNLTDPAEIAARSIEITLREYMTIRNDPRWADYRLWQDIGRMEMPVWAYVQQIVYKSYRIPLDFKLKGKIPLASLEIYDGLLCDLAWTDSGSLTADKTKLYPDASAFCIAQGQDLDLSDPLIIQSLTPEKFDKARDLWSPLNRFRIDQKNKCFVFEKAVFVPGKGNSALFIKANTVNDDTTNKYELERLVVPNAAATVAPASVRASICFAAERYAKWFGSGQRQSAEYVTGLSRHQVGLGNDASEITFANDNKTADMVAQDIADALLTRTEFIQSGGFRHHGTAGTALNGSVNRVTARLQFEDGGDGDGISEDIDFSKERNSKHFESERELERRQRSRDLFPGQREMKEQARKDRLLGKIAPTFKSNSSLDSCSAIATSKSNASVCLDSDTSYPAGMPVFAKPSADHGDALVVDKTGGFVGCIIADKTPAHQGIHVDVANSGPVDCRVKGPFSRGQNVGVNSGDNFASATGSYPVGTVQQAYSGTSVVVVKVMIGSTPRAIFKPFHLLVTTDPTDTNPAPAKKIRVYPSTLGGGSSIGGAPNLNFSPGDDPPYLLTPVVGVVRGHIQIDGDTGEITGRWIECVAALGTATDTDFFVEIGTVNQNLTTGAWSVNNSVYGPINVQICGGYDSKWTVGFGQTLYS